jgi:hypothetical protein
MGVVMLVSSRSVLRGDRYEMGQELCYLFLEYGADGM